MRIPGWHPFSTWANVSTNKMGKNKLMLTWISPLPILLIALRIFVVRFFIRGFFSPLEFSTYGFFAVHNFHLRRLSRTEISPYGVFAFRNFSRKEFSPCGNFAVLKFCRTKNWYKDFYKPISLLTVLSIPNRVVKLIKSFTYF